MFAFLDFYRNKYTESRRGWGMFNPIRCVEECLPGKTHSRTNGEHGKQINGSVCHCLSFIIRKCRILPGVTAFALSGYSWQ